MSSIRVRLDLSSIVGRNEPSSKRWLLLDKEALSDITSLKAHLSKNVLKNFRSFKEANIRLFLQDPEFILTNDQSTEIIRDDDLLIVKTSGKRKRPSKEESESEDEFIVQMKRLRSGKKEGVKLAKKFIARKEAELAKMAREQNNSSSSSSSSSEEEKERPAKRPLLTTKQKPSKDEESSSSSSSSVEERPSPIKKPNPQKVKAEKTEESSSSSPTSSDSDAESEKPASPMPEKNKASSISQPVTSRKVVKSQSVEKKEITKKIEEVKSSSPTSSSSEQSSSENEADKNRAIALQKVFNPPGSKMSIEKQVITKKPEEVESSSSSSSSSEDEIATKKSENEILNEEKQKLLKTVDNLAKETPEGKVKRKRRRKRKAKNRNKLPENPEEKEPKITPKAISQAESTINKSIVAVNKEIPRYGAAAPKITCEQALGVTIAKTPQRTSFGVGAVKTPQNSADFSNLLNLRNSGSGPIIVRRTSASTPVQISTPKNGCLAVNGNLTNGKRHGERNETPAGGGGISANGASSKKEIFEPLTKMPKVGDTILFKAHELSENYTPEIVEKRATVMETDSDTATLTLKMRLPKKRKDGKFELVYEEDMEEENYPDHEEQNVIETKNFMELMEPKILVKL